MMGSGFGFGIPGLGMLLVWGLVIWLVVWLVDTLGKGDRGTTKDARAVLDERFARGEIDREEYEERKRALI